MSVQTLKIINIWKDPQWKQPIQEFWQSLGVISSSEELIKRAEQLAFVAIDEDQIAGVTTAVETKINHLNNNYFYNFRALIHPSYRMPGLVDKLAVETIEFLESEYLQGKSACIGVITLIENDQMKKKRLEAVYPATGFTYIGHSKNGAQIRVKYFKGAQI